MSLRNVPRSQLTPEQRRKLDRAEQGRTGRKAVQRIVNSTTVPATGHPGYRRGQSS